MDEELEMIFENATTFEPISSYLFVHDGFFIFFALIGMLANVLIIYMIASNKKMKTNSNLIFMNWAIADALTLVTSVLSTELILKVIPIYTNPKKFYCTLIDLDAIFQIMVVTFVLALISKSDFKYTMKVNLINMAIYYFVMLGVAILSLVSCQMNYHLMFLPLVAVLMYIILFCIVVSKESICGCCGKKGNPLKKVMIVRMNVARIYTYLAMVSIICFLLVQFSDMPGYVRLLFQFFHLTGYLTSAFIVVYLAFADKKFQICLLNLLRKQEDQYNVDATIGFSDDENDDVDDEVDIEVAPSSLPEENQDDRHKEVPINPH